MKNNAVILQPAFILHARAYRDSSLLLELFTLDHGRVSAVARGARSARARYKGLLQPFVPLLVSWYGKSELVSLSGAEANGVILNLGGDTLLCGFYLNELLMRLLHRYDAHPQLFTAYQETLWSLQDSAQLARILRAFEKLLLSELGYALSLDRAADTGSRVEADRFYYFDPARGMLSYEETMRVASHYIFEGNSLLALHAGELSDKSCLQDAKRLLRIALNQLLDGKPLKSRELFI